MIQPKSMTAEQFLAWEDLQDTKHEFMNGKIINMAGGTLKHSALAVNLIMILGNYLKGKSCKIYNSDVKVQVAGNYFYPDLVISCELQDIDDTICQFPKLIIEILSNSTAKRDRTEKRFAYQQIETLEEYILISQEIMAIEIFCRSNHWQSIIFTRGSQVKLQSLGLSLHIEEIYQRIFD